MGSSQIRFMGLDIDSKKVGLVVIDENGKVCLNVCFRSKDDSFIKRADYLSDCVIASILNTTPCLIGYEEIPNYPSNYNAMQKMNMMIGAIALRVYLETGMELNPIKNSYAKKKVGLKGNASKEQVNDYMTERFNTVFQTFDQSDAALIAEALRLEFKEAEGKIE